MFFDLPHWDLLKPTGAFLTLVGWTICRGPSGPSSIFSITGLKEFSLLKYFHYLLSPYKTTFSCKVKDLVARSLEGGGFAPHPCQTTLEKQSKVLATSFGVTGSNAAWEAPPLCWLRAGAVNKIIFALTPHRSKSLVIIIRR